jgi:PTH1 family peptidyl-tRNA hydrolase
MKLIVGLGNPGNEYNKTRHNLGFLVLDKYLEENNLKFDKDKFESIYTIDRIGEDRVIFQQPMTFMNLSGTAVKQLSDFYKIKPEDILIVYDDKDLPVGDIRVRTKGSAGGHNGIKSIINQLGTENFGRLRIGIGSNPKINTADYVLGKFSKEDQEIIDNKMSGYIKEIDNFINKA